jgi:recombination protein RecT
MATQLAERTASPVAVFRQTLSTPAMREQIKMALPNHISVEKFERVALTAVQQTPALLNPQKVDRASLFGALVKAAQDGLLPDGREGAIVPYKGKAMWQPMVAGIMTKVRRSGEIANWEVAAVFERDEFERLLGDDQRIYHKPYEDGDPGEVVGAYSIVTFKDGTKSRDYMPRWRIEKARAQGAASDSLMWTKFYDEGAVKTVVKHHAKRLPMSTDVEAIFERDESMAPPGGYRAAEITPDKPPVSRLDAIEQQIDGETGEVHDEPDPPVEQPEITEQAEELEAEIEESPEQSPNVNDEADELTQDPADAAVESILKGFAQAELLADLGTRKVEADKHVPFMSETHQELVENAYEKHRKRLAGDKPKVEEPVK